MMFIPWRRALRSKALWFSLPVMLALGLVAALAPRLAPHDPYRNYIHAASLPPMWVQNPLRPGTADFPLGTDRYGRDILSRLMFGMRTAFILSLMAVPLAALAGTLIGLGAGYAGGRLDALFVLAADTLQSLPGMMIMVISTATTTICVCLGSKGLTLTD